jgi:hypothetical protein
MAVYPITPVPDGSAVRELRPYTAVVYTEGGHYYARDDRNRLICVDSPTACIMEAALAAKGGGRVLIRRGVYNVGKTIDLGSGDLNLAIEGEDMWSTVVAPASDIPVFRAVAGAANYVRRLSLRRLRIYGGGVGTGLVLGATQQNVLQYAALIAVEDVFFDSLKQSIYANNLWISRLVDVVSNGGVSGGPPAIQLDQNGADTSHDVYIVRLYSEGNGSRPLSLPPNSYDIVVRDSYIDAAVDYLIYMDPSSHDNAVFGSYLAGATSYAVYASPASRVEGNYVLNSANGIYSVGAVVRGNSLSGISGYGIYLTNPATYLNIVEGNAIQGVGTGIYSAADHAVIRGNRIYNASRQAIWVYYHVGALIEGNSIYQAQTSGGLGIIEIEGQYNVVKGNFVNSSTGTYAVLEGDGDYNTITDNSLLAPAAVKWVGAHTQVGNSPAFYKRSAGQASIPSGSTSVAVSHGLSCTPSKVLATPLAQPPGSIWISEISSTQFTINISSAPSSNLPVAWYAEC